MMLHIINKQLSAGLLACLFLTSLLFTGCEKDEKEISGVRLEVFGPSPALRGSEIKFIGNNLDRVTSVVLPGGMEITDITITNKGEIRITIPQDATPGLITLKSPEGDITTKTALTFSEPISIDKVSATTIKPGNVLSIEGDYLNLIQEVIFPQDVVVESSDFVSQSRKKIEVTVPDKAQSGKISLSNGAEIPLIVYSDDELEITLPAPTTPADLTRKKPGESITISGDNFDLVKELIVPEDIVTNFTVSANGKAITFVLPENAKDGAVLIVPASGVNVALANIGIAELAELSATPNTGVRPGDNLSIKGVNMELVTEIVFAGTTTSVDITSQSSTEVKVTVPDMAISGDIVLKTAAGKEASIAIQTAKSNALSYSANPVAAGATFTITGQHLDLLQTLTFGGDVTVDVDANSASSLTVAVPTTAESGTITATMKNGEQVIFPALNVDKPLVAYIPLMPEEEIANGKMWICTIANQDKLTGVQINGQHVQYVLDGDKLYIGIPSTVKGSSQLKLVSSNGDIAYDVNIKDSGIVETVIWDEGPLDITWGDGGRVMIHIDKFNGVKAGNYIKFYFQQKDAWGQAQINNGNWAGIQFDELGGNTITSHGAPIDNDKAITFVEFKLTSGILDNIRNNASNDNAIIIQGSDWIFEKVSIIDYGN